MLRSLFLLSVGYTLGFISGDLLGWSSGDYFRDCQSLVATISRQCTLLREEQSQVAVREHYHLEPTGGSVGCPSGAFALTLTSPEGQ